VQLITQYWQPAAVPCRVLYAQQMIWLVEVGCSAVDYSVLAACSCALPGVSGALIPMTCIGVVRTCRCAAHHACILSLYEVVLLICEALLLTRAF
jgi:hypothetical protein